MPFTAAIKKTIESKVVSTVSSWLKPLQKPMAHLQEKIGDSTRLDSILPHLGLKDEEEKFLKGIISNKDGDEFYITDSKNPSVLSVEQKSDNNRLRLTDILQRIWLIEPKSNKKKIKVKKRRDDTVTGLSGGASLAYPLDDDYKDSPDDYYLGFNGLYGLPLTVMLNAYLNKHREHSHVFLAILSSTLWNSPMLFSAIKKATSVVPLNGQEIMKRDNFDRNFIDNANRNLGMDLVGDYAGLVENLEFILDQAKMNSDINSKGPQVFLDNIIDKAKAQAEAKARAEAEAKERAQAAATRIQAVSRGFVARKERSAQAEAQARVEAEAQARAEAEAKARAEAQARAEAEAKARAEAQAKARAEAEAKARAEAEAKARAEAEAKARAEAQARAEAEAKARAEAEAQAQAEAQGDVKAAQGHVEAEQESVRAAQELVKAEQKSVEGEELELSKAKAQAQVEAKARAEAEGEVKAARSELLNEEKALLSEQESVNAAKGLVKAEQKCVEGEKLELLKVHEQVEVKKRAEAKAKGDVKDAQGRVEAAQVRVNDAQVRVNDAQVRVNDAQERVKAEQESVELARKEFSGAENLKIFVGSYNADQQKKKKEYRKFGQPRKIQGDEREFRDFLADVSRNTTQRGRRPWGRKNLHESLHDFYKKCALENIDLGGMGLSNYIESKRSALNAAQERVKAAQERVKAEQESVKVAQERVKAQQESVTVAEERVKAAQERVEAQQESVTAAQGRVEAAQERVKVAQGRVEVAEVGVTTAQGRVEDAQGRVEDAQGRVEDAQGRVTVAEERVKDAQLALSQVKAATRIQAVSRGIVARKERSAQVEVATRIQAVSRGFVARKERSAQVKAATRIQAVSRGIVARKERSAQVKAATRIQAVSRGIVARKERSAQVKAATRIQAVSRGFVARKERSAQQVNELINEIHELSSQKIIFKLPRFLLALASFLACILPWRKPAAEIPEVHEKARMVYNNHRLNKAKMVQLKDILEDFKNNMRTSKASELRQHKNTAINKMDGLDLGRSGPQRPA